MSVSNIADQPETCKTVPEGAPAKLEFLAVPKLALTSQLRTLLARIRRPNVDAMSRASHLYRGSPASGLSAMRF